MRNVAILGSTGSIGKQTLQIASEFKDEVNIVGLAANTNLEELRAQIDTFKPKYAATATRHHWQAEGIRQGPEALIEMVSVPEVDLVVVAVVGAAGLLPTLAALEAGKLVALANKETLVMAGTLIRRHLAKGGELVPIDSEHSAIWQCLRGESAHSIEKLVLTASGGAFRDCAAEELAKVTPRQALCHPTWRMGPKVTVDSATLMNKGLEVVEATLLFEMAFEQVEVVMHRESIVHSMVQFKDSSVKAQLSLPDMRLPIQYALNHPDRWPNAMERLNLCDIGCLHFGRVDWDRYPCLRLAVDAGRRGGTYPAALCAADEVAVDMFLDSRIRFTDISNVVAATLEGHVSCQESDLDAVLAADASARDAARIFALSLNR